MIKFHRWKVVANRVIDEDNFSMDVTSGQYRFTDVWVNRGGRWQAVASQATVLAKQ